VSVLRRISFFAWRAREIPILEYYASFYLSIVTGCINMCLRRRNFCGHMIFGYKDHIKSQSPLKAIRGNYFLFYFVLFVFSLFFDLRQTDGGRRFCDQGMQGTTNSGWWGVGIRISGTKKYKYMGKRRGERIINI
jgi:hypothetical protein